MKTPEHTVATRWMESGVGRLALYASGAGLCGVAFGHRAEDEVDGRGKSVFLDQAEEELGEYFEKGRREFSVALDPAGTAFQMAVWGTLREIRYGATASYLDIAKAIKNPKAVRAVGMANGANPISIIVPCHRIIGADGSLTGYGGGLDIKEALLAHEGALVV